MPNYYETLHVAPTATAAEVETAYEMQYNQWRRLVTHHDPKVVNQANQALQTLESIRETLTDPAKRAAYDAGNGLSGSTGGLADPAALFQSLQQPAMPAPPAPSSAPAPVGQMQRVDAWVCPKCQTANPIGTRFCQTCGLSLGYDCPNCGKLMESRAQFCSNCGANVQLAETERRQREAEAAYARELEAQRLRLAQQQAMANLAILEPKKNLAISASNWRTTGCILAFFIPFVSIPMWIYSVVKAKQVLNSLRVPGDEEHFNRAKSAFWWSIVPLVLTGVTLMFYICIAILTVTGGAR